MKTFLALLFLLVSGVLTCKAHSDSKGKESLEGLSSSEIRQFFLNSTPGTDVRTFAIQSKQRNTSSIVWFTVGGLFALGGIYGIVELNKLNKSLSNLDDRFGIILASTLSFSISGIAITMGVVQNKKSKKYLDIAINRYKVE